VVRSKKLEEAEAEEEEQRNRGVINRSEKSGQKEEEREGNHPRDDS
jgi:hypothetical protein